MPLPSNLVQQTPGTRSLRGATPSSQGATTRRTRLLLRRSLQQQHQSAHADDNGLWDVPPTQDEAEEDDEDGEDGAEGKGKRRNKPKRKKGRDKAERDKPRYLVNTGVIYQQLPRLLEMTRERLLQRDYRAAARCMTVAFRVHRLDNDTVFKCMAQLLSAPSPPTDAPADSLTQASTSPFAGSSVSAASIYVDMVRLYRRMRVVRPAQPMSFPAVETKNASQLRLELSVLLQRQGKAREAVEEMGKALDEGGLAGVALMEGWTGVLHCLLAEEAAERMAQEESKRSARDDDEEERRAREEAAEDDEDELPLSLSMFIHSQRSHVHAPASASTSLLSTHLASLSQHKAAAVKHLNAALASQPESSTWLYYILHAHTNLHPSDVSPALALRAVHTFTLANPSDAIAWRLKLSLLLRHYKRLAAAVRCAGRQLLSLDVCSVEGLRTLVWEWQQGRVASDELLVWLLQRLDVSEGTAAAGEARQVWQWLHEALHGLLDTRMDRRGGAWWGVQQVEAQAAVAEGGGEGEWEVDRELEELRAREEEEAEEASNKLMSQQLDSDNKLGSDGHQQRTKREAIHAPSASTPSSPASALPLPPADVLDELQQRLEWWPLSASHMRELEATSGLNGACGVDEQDEGENGSTGELRRCCLGLMRALVQL